MPCWPCSHCEATTHYPSNCSFHYHTVSTSASGQQPPTFSTPTSGKQPPASMFSSGQQPSTTASISRQQPTTTGGTNYASPTCHTFNHSFCHWRNCTYTHHCEHCGATHSAKHCPTWGALLSKSKPWAPILPFILERKSSLYQDQAFVLKLIYDLCHGCTIGYSGSQFFYLANYLVFTYQYPDVIGATLEKECELGHILGPFESPPLSNFQTPGLSLVPKHDNGWWIIYHLSAPDDFNISS